MPLSTIVYYVNKKSLRKDKYTKPQKVPQKDLSLEEGIQRDSQEAMHSSVRALPELFNTDWFVTKIDSLETSLDVFIWYHNNFIISFLNELALKKSWTWLWSLQKCQSKQMQMLT